MLLNTEDEFKAAIPLLGGQPQLSKRKILLRVLGLSCLCMTLAVAGFQLLSEGQHSPDSLKIQAASSISASSYETSLNQTVSPSATGINSTAPLVVKRLPTDPVYSPPIIDKSLFDHDAEAKMVASFKPFNASEQNTSSLQLTGRSGFAAEVAVANNILTELNKVTSFISEVNPDNERLKALASIAGGLGRSFAVVGAVFKIADAFKPNPVMAKLNEISNQITALDRKVTQQFAQLNSLIVATSCWVEIGKATLSIKLVYDAYQIHLASGTPGTKAEFVRMFASERALFHTTYLLEALSDMQPQCHASEILYNGDHHTNYQQGVAGIIGLKGSELLLHASKGVAVISAYYYATQTEADARAYIDTYLLPRQEAAVRKVRYTLDWSWVNWRQTLEYNARRRMGSTGSTTAGELGQNFKNWMNSIYPGKAATAVVFADLDKQSTEGWVGTMVVMHTHDWGWGNKLVMILTLTRINASNSEFDNYTACFWRIPYIKNILSRASVDANNFARGDVKRCANNDGNLGVIVWDKKPYTWEWNAERQQTVQTDSNQLGGSMNTNMLIKVDGRLQTILWGV